MRKLYRPGDTTTVWGISCDFSDFGDDEVETALKAGWYANPLDFDTPNELMDETFTREELKKLARDYDIVIKNKSDLTLLKEIQDAKRDAGQSGIV